MKIQTASNLLEGQEPWVDFYTRKMYLGSFAHHMVYTNLVKFGSFFMFFLRLVGMMRPSFFEFMVNKYSGITGPLKTDNIITVIKQGSL